MDLEFQLSMNRQTVFGAGTIKKLPQILGTYGSGVFLLTGRSFPKMDQWNSLIGECGEAGLVLNHGEIHGEPDPDSVDTIVSALRENRPDVIAAIGGGSVLDAGKAVSAMLMEEGSVEDYLEGVGSKSPSGNKIPFVAVPTTSGTGSEATKNAVISRPGKDGFKKSLRHNNYVPDTALIDPELMRGCPLKVTASCGLDAFSQLLESFISTAASPITDALCWSALTRFIDSFMTICLDEPMDTAARADLAYGAYISGITLAHAGLGAVHGIAGTLGGLCGIPHGTACANLLVPVMNMTVDRLRESGAHDEVLEKIARLGRYVAEESSLEREEACDYLLCMLNEWVEVLKIPFFSSYDIKRDVLVKAAELSGNKNNPAVLDQEQRLQALLHRF